MSLNQDEKPYTSLPIRRFQVSITTKDDAVHKNNSFKIFNMKRTYFIVADDSKALLRYVYSSSSISIKGIGRRGGSSSNSSSSNFYDLLNYS